VEKMFYRQKLLLAIIQIFGGKLHRTDLQKYLFLFTANFQKEKSYHFVPYKFGCFSFQSYADRRRLIEQGHLLNVQDWVLNNKSSTDYLDEVKNSDFVIIQNFHKTYKNIKGKELVREVYLNYPFYAINSKIAENLLNGTELREVEKFRPKEIVNPCFYTIGYEGKSLEVFINQLIENSVRLLCDVRANPLSRKFGFSKKVLSETLGKMGIEYLHMPELGITSKKRKGLTSTLDYEILFKEYENTTLIDAGTYLEQLYQIFLQKKRVAITCFEANPCMCHRSKILEGLEKFPDWKFATKHL